MAGRDSPSERHLRLFSALKPGRDIAKAMSMGSNRYTFQRLAGRAVVAAVLAYALVVLSVFSPVLRAKAIEETRQAAMLGVLCLPDANGDIAENGKPANPHHQDLGCCLPGKRFVLDAPAVTPEIPVFEVPQRALRRVIYAVPQSRAPPVRAEIAVNARAPPIPA